MPHATHDSKQQSATRFPSFQWQIPGVVAKVGAHCNTRRRQSGPDGASRRARRERCKRRTRKPYWCLIRGSSLVHEPVACPRALILPWRSAPAAHATLAHTDRCRVTLPEEKEEEEEEEEEEEAEAEAAEEEEEEEEEEEGLFKANAVNEEEEEEEEVLLTAYNK